MYLFYSFIFEQHFSKYYRKLFYIKKKANKICALPVNIKVYYFAYEFFSLYKRRHCIAT